MALIEPPRPPPCHTPLAPGPRGGRVGRAHRSSRGIIRTDAPLPRPHGLSVALIASTVGAGLALRMIPVGLPPAVVKHGGSILWGLMIYWIVAALRPRWTTVRCAFVAVLIAGTVETSQLYHAPALDAFRRTGIGALLLGRVFSGWDLIAYGASIALGAGLDAAIRRRLWHGT